MMQVIICGAGRFGLLAALDLVVMGDYNVTLIDQSEILMQYLSESYDFYCVHGDATDPDVLIKANIQNCDMIIAATSSDANNMVICQVAHSLFKVKHKIARLHRDTFQDNRWCHLFGNNDLPIDHVMIPEWSIVQSLIHLLNINGAQEVVPFFDGTLLLIKSSVLSKSYAAGKTVKDIKQFISNKISNNISNYLSFNIITIERQGKYQILTDDDILLENDTVYLLTTSKFVFLTMDLLGHGQILANKMLIIGEGEVLRLLTRWCVNTTPKIDFTVLTRHRRQADALLSEFANISVMTGNPFHEKLLSEVNTTGVDLALAVDNNEQTNILTALAAKVIGIRRTIAVVHNPFFLKMTNLINVDLLLNPRGVILSSILKIIRRGYIDQMQSLHEHKAELLEWVIDQKVIKAHHDIFVLKDEIFPLAVFRQKQIIMPLARGFKLKIHDRVLILIPIQSRNKLEKIISQKL